MLCGSKAIQLLETHIPASASAACESVAGLSALDLRDLKPVYRTTYRLWEHGEVIETLLEANPFDLAQSPRRMGMGDVSTKAWWAALKRARIENFRWHDLRHTFATWHRQAGTPTHELQRLGGWKTLSMVERYAHIAPEGLQSAASRLDSPLQSYAMATPKEKKD